VNPFVFLVGCPRSGTTLLHRLVDAHPEAAIVHETLWIAKFWERRVGLTPDGRVTRELAVRLHEHRRFGQLGIDQAALDRLVDAHTEDTYAELVTALFDLYGAGRGKPFVGDKSPGYVRSIPTLHELWPQARFVHLIRDGRDVCLSAINWKKADRVFRDHATWPQEPIATAALWWERSVRLGREAGASLPSELYAEVRYEDVVAHPARECRRICAFLGLEYDEAMIRFHEGRTRETPGLTTKRKWLPPTAGLRDWRTDMSRDEVASFEAAAGDLLDELGYERGALDLDGDLALRTRAVRHRFAGDVALRGRPLPEGWV
jgi:sulfotransferase family protein